MIFEFTLIWRPENIIRNMDLVSATKNLMGGGRLPPMKIKLAGSKHQKRAPNPLHCFSTCSELLRKNGSIYDCIDNIYHLGWSPNLATNLTHVKTEF